MKKQLLCLLAGTIFTAGINHAQVAKWLPASTGTTHYRIDPNLKPNEDYVADKIIFQVKDKYRNLCQEGYINDPALMNTFNMIGVQSLKKLFPRHQPPAEKYNSWGAKYADLSLIYEVKVTGPYALEKSINAILKSGLMEFAEPRFIYKTSIFMPNDPDANASGKPQYNYLNRIKAYDAWDLGAGGTQGDTNVVIGIVDSGSDTDHPDLLANFKFNYADPIGGGDQDGDGYVDNFLGWDFAGADYNNIVEDNDANIYTGSAGHGSHVSGCASAVTNNGIGVAGVGFKCKLLPVKCSADNDTRANGMGYILTGYEGITYAADHGAHIINCSWGGGGGGSFGQTIIDYATINKNCLVVAAAGNNGQDAAFYPAAYNYVLSVAATNATNDTKASFSNFNYTVDISAPGVNIQNTYWNDTYTQSSGTSMASPIVAGGAGLVKAKFPTYNGLQVGQRLITTTDYHYSGANISYLNKLGSGRLNLFKAVTNPNGPSVVLTNKTITDGNDQAFVIGDTLNIVGTFVNYLAPTTNATAVISVQSGGTYVNAVSTNHTIGVLGTLASNTNASAPYRYVILAGTPQNSKITFKVTITDGAYTAAYFFDVTVNVDYINVAINDVGTTITSKGKIGWNQDGAVEGLGFTYFGNNLLYEAGLMIGTSNSAVSDCVRGVNGTTADADFANVNTVQLINPSVKSEFDVTGLFNDNPASPSQNLDVRHNAYAWSTLGHRKYVIVEYIIKNKGVALNNLFAGIMADWDVDGNTYASNKSKYDASRKLGYTWATVAPGYYAGIKVLTTGPGVFYGIDNVAGGGGGVDINDAGNYYSTADKYLTLSTHRDSAGYTAAPGNDVLNVVSTGPFTLNTNDSVKVAFALLAGDDLTDLQKSADSAQVKYDGLPFVGIKETIKGSVLNVYPNPANNQVTFTLDMAQSGKAELMIINNLGQTVKTLSQEMPSGILNWSVDLSSYPAGTYFYRLKTPAGTGSGKLNVIK